MCAVIALWSRATRGEARERIASTHVDLALVTLEMDGIDGVAGVALICQLKLLASGVPMILVSTVASSGGRAHSADGFLGKSTSPADLVERVRVMTQRKRGEEATEVNRLARCGGALCLRRGNMQARSAPTAAAWLVIGQAISA